MSHETANQPNSKRKWLKKTGWSKTEPIDWKEKVSWTLHFRTAWMANPGNGVATVHRRMTDRIVVAKNCRHCCRAWRQGIWKVHAWHLLHLLILIRLYQATHISQKSAQLCKAATCMRLNISGWSYKVEVCKSPCMQLHKTACQWASEKAPWTSTQAARGLIFLLDLWMRLLKMQSRGIHLRTFMVWSQHLEHQ